MSAHIQAYSNPKVRQVSCSAWGLLYRELIRLGLPQGAVRFETGGKPVFIGEDLYFSLSHSREVCAVSIADVPTGVDVELIRTDQRPRLIERSLSETERKAYDGDFTRLWCRKEAIAKLAGTGIAGYPSRINTLDKRWEYEERRIEHNGRAYWLAAVFPRAVSEVF